MPTARLALVGSVQGSGVVRLVVGLCLCYCNTVMGTPLDCMTHAVGWSLALALSFGSQVALGSVACWHPGSLEKWPAGNVPIAMVLVAIELLAMGFHHGVFCDSLRCGAYGTICYGSSMKCNNKSYGVVGEGQAAGVLRWTVLI